MNNTVFVPDFSLEVEEKKKGSQPIVLMLGTTLLYSERKNYINMNIKEIWLKVNTTEVTEQF